MNCYVIMSIRDRVLLCNNMSLLEIVYHYIIIYMFIRDHVPLCDDMFY